MKLRTLAVLPLLLVTLVAQELPDKPTKQRDIDRRSADAGEAIEDDGVAGKEREMVKVDPNARRRGTAFCQFKVHSDPVKLMPGQSGTVTVTAVLLGTAVLPADNPLRLMSTPQQGMLTLGSPTILPPQPGHLHKAFQGTLVYDNYAIMEVPVTVSPEARIGSTLGVALQFDYELLNGDNGVSIGKFSDVASGKIEVGLALDPAVKGGFTPIEVPEVGSAAPAARPVAATGSATEVTPRPDAIGGTEARVRESQAADPAVRAPTTPPSGMPAVEVEEGQPWGLILGGGAALLAIVLLLAMRRK